MVIMEKAPNPNAARLWVDFYHSKKGMELLVPLMGFGVARDDVKVPALVQSISPPVDKMNLIRIDWSNFTSEDKKKVRAQFRSIFFAK